MTNDDQTTRSEPSDAERVRDQIRSLETHVAPEKSRVNDRISTVRERLREYENADSDRKETDTVDKLESELKDVRQTVEEELEEGKQKAHEIVDDVEQKVKNLRSS